MRTREDYVNQERRLLAPYASLAAESRGRKHAEPEHPIRSAFERDRDRVIHSSAFRKLEYKTQVFVNHEGDYYRTRLTHTLEACQISRSVARFLRLNEDLAEAIALVHDVGHPPFGHAGEAALQELMRDQGGFEHNLQGLRVVDRIESRYPDWPGLNLTREVREAIAKHSQSSGVGQAPELAEFGAAPWPSLEAQVADVCDQIAYNAHDVDDGLTAGLITLEQLAGLELWREVTGKAIEGLSPVQAKHLGVRCLINEQVQDVLCVVEERARDWSLRSADDVRSAPGLTATLSEGMAGRNQELREFLFRCLYRNYRVVRMSTKARRVLEDLFRSYEATPQQLPPGAVKEGQPLHRSICDYLAGLTDREALDEHRRLFDPGVQT